MAANKCQIFEFGDFVLDPAERLLLLRGRPLRLTPKTFDLLVALVRHRGHLVSKEQLLDEVWPRTFVAEVNLSVNISTLRRLLGRNRVRQKFIQTVAKRGYRFVAPTKTSGRATTLFLRADVRCTPKLRPSRDAGKEDAHRAYLQGRYRWNRRTVEGLESAIQHFWRSLAFDASYAPAYAGLADACAAQGYLSYVAPADAFAMARRHASTALSLDATLAAPHASIGYVNLYHDWDWSSAEKEFRLAISLDRGGAEAHQWFSTFLLAAGRPVEAYRELELAHARDPLSLAINSDLGFLHYYTRRYGDAIKQTEAVLEMNAEFPAAHLWRGRSLQELGRYDDAIASFQRVDNLLSGWPVSIAARGHAQAVAGRVGAAKETLAELRQLATRKFVTSYGVALIYAGLGEVDAAFTWLDRAFAERSNWLVWLRLDPRWDNLRADPRFPKLVRRLRYPTWQG
jgi:DNA-binding winged helix-turn-helix (wHTH) protein